jgi:hypothetical protein
MQYTTLSFQALRSRQLHLGFSEGQPAPPYRGEAHVTVATIAFGP